MCILQFPLVPPALTRTLLIYYLVLPLVPTYRPSRTLLLVHTIVGYVDHARNNKDRSPEISDA